MHKDLDQSDVNADAQRMLSDEMDELSNELDPCDIATVLLMMHDASDSGEPFADWIARDAIALDIITWSQSDPEKAIPILIRIAEVEDALGKF